MSSIEIDLNNDGLIELNIRPDQMSIVDPPIRIDEKNDEYSRLFNSLISLTLTERLISHSKLDDYLSEHIQMERIYSEQDDLKLVWSDEICLVLCFLASLAHQGYYQPNHLVQRYFQWWMNGYMCPTGLCFTPHVNIKKSMDLFGESQAAHALGIEIDYDKRTSTLHMTATALIRLSPIAYFYRKSSKEKRLEILQDVSKRMFGKSSSLKLVEIYIEMLVQSFNGQTKESIIESIDFKYFNSNDFISRIFLQFIEILRHDQNDFQQGIYQIVQLINKKNSNEEEQCRYLNPYDADSTILLSLYLQLASSIYNCHPSIDSNDIYAYSMIKSLIKWIFYQSQIRDLH